jgi:hypothetical protein
MYQYDTYILSTTLASSSLPVHFILYYYSLLASRVAEHYQYFIIKRCLSVRLYLC